MTFSNTLALALAMLVLAATPGPGVLLVTSQTALNGIRAGIFTTIGIISADIVFILLVGYGLSSLSNQLDGATRFISIFGGIYLLYIGCQAIRTSLKKMPISTPSDTVTSHKDIMKFLSSGFFITMSNPKAILFYVSFLPAFVDLNLITNTDIFIIACTASIVIGPTMMFYAFLTNKASQLSNQSQSQTLTALTSGLLIIIVGLYMLTRSIITP
jgi:threonine/homoserine/homoserine lactone efflux protein